FVPLISVGSSGGEVKIGLLKFDLSGLDNNRPARSANLLIYNCFAGSDVPLNIEARLITEPWDEDTVTYNNRPAAKETLSTLTLQGVRTFSDPGKWYSFDVTQAVEAWQLGAANNGIMLVPQGDASVYFEFVCKEAAGAPDRRPKLEITY
ncbi:MAG TPA: DNRLRE domain-containing protein, partial [Candidatus Sulfotelmatobacter sp.]|nr:DNRLRE domain-containing protein [Candidatus Sulfotelmatobacter sp.]